jgi:hypothetical protein
MAGQHTALIEAVHRAGPIVTLPADRVRWTGPNGEASLVPEVPGLAAAMQRAFAEEKTLSACGFSPGARHGATA